MGPAATPVEGAPASRQESRFSEFARQQSNLNDVSEASEKSESSLLEAIVDANEEASSPDQASEHSESSLLEAIVDAKEEANSPDHGNGSQTSPSPA